MVALSAGIAITAAASAYASQLVYTPVNPTFGGSPQNGSWLLSQASAQGKAASGSGSSGSGFSIDFPSFGTVTQPAAATTTLPDTTTNSGTTN
ncbi:curli assembly protein CsgF [Rhizobium sp. L245/93]|nr:curli assembly protein CsgF [Rhizobium sp. L245/93]QXZ81385.1 curli assembly protein CsgF [Rhizobium sp. L51/94]